MNTTLYEGSHRQLFEAFLKLVDDSDAQLTAILNSTSWREVRSVLTIGGGQGIMEASLLRKAPNAGICYLDPSEEQCAAFRKNMKNEGLESRVKVISQSTFQEFTTEQTFDRILSLFSWFYIGVEERWLTKLMDLLNPGGTALIMLPNEASIETEFYKALSPDSRMALVGEDIVKALNDLKFEVSQETYIKWLSREDLYDGEQLSDGSRAFAAFAAERPFDSFNPGEKEKIVTLLETSQKSQGVPLSWDLILARRSL
jgi:cyclopropane fatty-acyl-phospholipid synthase-like methyltransferase